MSEYRDPASREIAPLTLRYVIFRPGSLLYILPWVAGLLWVVPQKSGLPMLEHAAIGAVWIALLCFAFFPIVRVRAAFENGELVVRGSRLPYPDQMWMMNPKEAVKFMVLRTTEEKNPHWFIALRANDGDKEPRHLPVTPLFQGGPEKHEATVTRLNAWLEQLH